MTFSSAAVEPTSDSALPIRAKLFGGRGEDGDTISYQRTIRNPKIKDFRGGRDFALPIRAELYGGPKIVGNWVARLIAAPLNQRATKASALPIRAELSGGPEVY